MCLGRNRQLYRIRTKEFGEWRQEINWPLPPSMTAQLVKNLPATYEIRVGSLGPEDPLEKEMATHSSILAWRILWTEETYELVHGVTKSRPRLWLTLSLSQSMWKIRVWTKVLVVKLKGVRLQFQRLFRGRWVEVHNGWILEIKELGVLMAARGARQTTVHRVTKSPTRLEWLSTHTRTVVMTESSTWQNRKRSFADTALKWTLKGLVWSAEESSQQRCAENSCTLCSGAHDSEMKIKV